MFPGPRWYPIYLQGHKTRPSHLYFVEMYQIHLHFFAHGLDEKNALLCIKQVFLCFRGHTIQPDFQKANDSRL